MTTGQSLALETRVPENAGACHVWQALNLEDHPVPFNFPGIRYGVVHAQIDITSKSAEFEAKTP
jgi:hypothetical protein